MKRKGKLDAEEVQNLISQYKAGYSSVQIGEQMCLSPATVINYLKREGVERRPAGAAQEATPELAELARQMRADGVCWKTISRKIGLGPKALSKAIKELGTRINLETTLGQGPRLYAVVVSGHLHQRPTLWNVRAWDAAAAEVIAVAEAGYAEDDMDYWADSTLIGEIL